MASEVARARLMEERKNWRRDKPFGYLARPERNPDGSVNFARWTCRIPGKPGTEWEGGFFPLTMDFPDEYPTKPPKVSQKLKLMDAVVWFGDP
eukprot:g7199.t1